jgi:5'-3' exonuclease
MGDSTDNIVGIPGVGIKTAENWLKDRTKDFESFAIRKYVEKFGMVEGIMEFHKNFNLVYLLKTDEDLARLGLGLPPLEYVDISQNELDIWKDDE